MESRWFPPRPRCGEDKYSEVLCWWLTRADAELRELVARQGNQMAEANASIAVLQQMLFGRSSERSGPAPTAVTASGLAGSRGPARSK